VLKNGWQTSDDPSRLRIPDGASCGSSHAKFWGIKGFVKLISTFPAIFEIAPEFSGDLRMRPSEGTWVGSFGSHQPAQQEEDT